MRSKNNSIILINLILLETFFVILIFNYYIYIIDDFTSIQNFLLISNVTVVIIAVSVVFLIKNIEQEVCNESENNFLKTHLIEVEGLLKTLQNQRHEHSRHIQTLQAMLHLEEYEKAIEYIDGITERYWHSQDIVYVGNPALTALLNSKKEIADNKKIEFALSIKCNLANIPVKPWDLCSIIGNLLDNAIEAVLLNFESKKKRVSIEIKYENQNYVIYVYNSGPSINKKALSNIFNAGYTTKGSKARGYGLYLVNELIEQYNGNIEVVSKEKTTFIVYIPYKRGVKNA